MKKILALIIAAASFLSCNSHSNRDKSDSASEDLSKYVIRKPDSGSSATTSVAKDVPKPIAKDTAATAAATPSQPETSESEAWSYSEDVDKATSAKNYYAAVNANQLLNFPFPYDGGSTATLTIRNNDNKNEVILTVSKGQFVASVDGGSVKIGFDDARPVKYSASEPSDGSTNVLFIENSNKLIKKIKASQKVIIEAGFYESGLKTMDFNVKGFKWEH
jgi:hypothetical protein